MKFRMFIVNKETWKEHKKVGIAAVNDPLITHPTNRNKIAQRQGAICDVADIRPGDILIFYAGIDEIHGLYVATSNPYFCDRPLTPRFTKIIKEMYRKKYKKKPEIFRRIDFNKTHPFRVNFKQLVNLPYPIKMDDIWTEKERGGIWSIQQSRGDAVAVKACYGFSRPEAEIIIRMFEERNIIKKKIERTHSIHTMKKDLDKVIDVRMENRNQLHLEGSLHALLLRDLANGKHKNIFGNYDDFISHLPLGSRKEIDIILFKYDKKGVVWYQILELKNDKFTMNEIRTLIDYEKWLSKTQGNDRNVYSVAVAADFDNDENVKEYIEKMEQYNKKMVRLIKYSFNPRTKKLSFTNETPKAGRQTCQ